MRTLDILPTLSNLFGLDFDSRLYMGRDVFSDAEPFVLLRDHSWITESAMYYAPLDELILLQGDELTPEEVERPQSGREQSLPRLGMGARPGLLEIPVRG